MICIEINENSIIAVDTGEDSPVDFMKKNQNTEYILDASIHPRIIDSMLGEKNVYYASEYNESSIKNNNRWNQFKVNIFKEDGEISGAPIGGIFSPMLIDCAITEIEKVTKKIRPNSIESVGVISPLGFVSYKKEEIGSIFFQVDFINEEPHTITEFKIKGFTFNEMMDIIQIIYDNIPPNQK
ncbi:hypothetical protein [Winogradskyella psychrotolerans]|uniref:hypothetical protein n=1 Tax=Winogradskyella psychrotolerans TaxID=1344585 RepID=UPI001C06699D|nr:hypothetical protein [Winogradskyella psychrotolerans]MBU2928854.1 hypothetical protein [Winogradskyella psychrotolerans]